jgi:DNA-directed RNA polymerase specialized sigma24 family protein
VEEHIAVPPPERPRRSHRDVGETWESPSAEDYASYRPLLFRALMSLARQGYEVPADEGLELVHEFFLEAWPGLLHRYDSARGSFSTYVFGAFLRFARPRIVVARSWHERFVDWDAAVVERPDPVQPLHDTSLDRPAVRRALATLGGPDRDLLARWLAGDANVRRTARAIGLSRYKTRQELVAALTRLAAAMGQQIGSSESDWRVARALWVEGRSVADAALSLGISAAQVRRARQRVFQFLGAALGDRPQTARTHEASDVS